MNTNQAPDGARPTQSPPSSPTELPPERSPVVLRIAAVIVLIIGILFLIAGGLCAWLFFTLPHISNAYNDAVITVIPLMLIGWLLSYIGWKLCIDRPDKNFGARMQLAYGLPLCIAAGIWISNAILNKNILTIELVIGVAALTIGVILLFNGWRLFNKRKRIGHD
jgi:hypothetical protein